MLEQKLGVNRPVSGEPVVPRGIGGSWAERVTAADEAERQHEVERQHEAEWVRVDQKLRGIAERRAALDAEETRLLRCAEELSCGGGGGERGRREVPCSNTVLHARRGDGEWAGAQAVQRRC